LTIAVGVACPEGIVLAADSRATIVGSGYFRVVTDYARKLFALDERFGVATFGWGFLEGNTVGGAMEEFAAQTKKPKDVGDAAEKLRDYFAERLRRHLERGDDEPPQEGFDVLGFMIGGYDREGVGRLKFVYLPSGDIEDGAATSANDCGAHWKGESDVFSRLLKGFDAIRLSAGDWSEEQRKALDDLAYLVPFWRMALQDAIDFASFAVNTTIDMQRFSDGTFGQPGGFPTCGGTAEVLAITDRGLEWIQRTTLRPALRGPSGGASGG
jgi:hypothetical protein